MPQQIPATDVGKERRLGFLALVIIVLLLAATFGLYYWQSTNTISGLNKTITSQASVLSSQSRDISSASTRIANLSSTVSALQSRLSTLESEASADKAEINSITSKDSEANQTISSLNSKVSSLNSQISSIEAQLKFLGSTFTAISSLPVTVENVTSSFTAEPQAATKVGGFIALGTGYVAVNITSLSQVGAAYVEFGCNCSFVLSTNSTALSVVGPYPISGTSGLVLVPVIAPGDVFVFVYDQSSTVLYGEVSIAYYTGPF